MKLSEQTAMHISRLEDKLEGALNELRLRDSGEITAFAGQNLIDKGWMSPHSVRQFKERSKAAADREYALDNNVRALQRANDDIRGENDKLRAQNKRLGDTIIEIAIGGNTDAQCTHD